MGTVYRYIEEPREPSKVLDWVRSGAIDVEEVPLPLGVLFCLREFGPLILADDGSVDVHRSPLVTVFVPRIRRGILWTVGEVHFLATPLRRLYPPLHRLNRALGNWLQHFECVFANGRCPKPEWEYHLEGFVRNDASPIFALPDGLQALNSGQYFVAKDDTELQLDKLCQALRLRGVQCKPED
jgi:hypothetical protein